MNDVVEKRGRSPMRKVWLVLFVVIMLIAIVLGFYFALSSNSINKRLVELQEAGYPTNFTELAEYTKLPDGADNAADTYLEAFDAYFPPVDEVNTPVIGRAELPDRGDPLTEPMIKAIANCLDENKKCLAFLHEAGRMKYCKYQWDYAGESTHLSKVRKSAQLLQLATVFYSDRDDPNRAAVCIHDGLKLSDSLQREPMLIGYLVRISCIAVPIYGLERALCMTSLSDEQLRQLDQMFEKTEKTLDLSETLVTERCYIIESFTNPSLLSGMGNEGKILKVPFIGKTGLIDYLDYMADCIEAAKLSGMQRRQRFLDIQAEVDNMSFVHVVIKMLAPALSRVGELDLRAKSNISVARAGIAIERYRLAKAKLPQQLDQLVPQYMEQVPMDPFDGKPIRYKLTNPGYILYSIGEDCQDNDGKERDPKKRDEPYDFTFIVTR